MISKSFQTISYLIHVYRPCYHSKIPLEALQNVILRIQQFNPNVHIVITVSPVRHIKDGIIENKVKPFDRSGTHTLKICKTSPIFLLMNGLWMTLETIDFIQMTLIHPAQNAIQYIWENFQTII